MTRQARITQAFRIADGEGTRKYTPGEVAEGRHATWAIENGKGVEIDADGHEVKAASKPTNKAKPKPENKGAAE